MCVYCSDHWHVGDTLIMPSIFVPGFYLYGHKFLNVFHTILDQHGFEKTLSS